jgi:hypothetical protein
LKALRRTLLPVLATAASAAPAGVAQAARVRVSFSGQDTLAWSVAAGRECTRFGSGRQTVTFADRRPVTAQMGALRARGHTLVVFGRAHEGALSVPGTASVTRVDETTLSPGNCDPMPAKDCGVRALPQFFPTVWSAENGGLALHGEYWRDEPDAPFLNCMGFQTPESAAGNERPYSGWHFGDELPRRINSDNEAGDIASKPLSPASLRIGHTYRFVAHRVIQLSGGDLHGYVIWPDGREGPAVSEVLGGETTVTDNVSWQITLKRLS